MGGGGARGLVYIPCIRILEKYNILKDLKVIIGTSVGALIGMLYNIGYSGIELEKIFLKFNPGDYNWINENNILNYFNKFGINSGEGFEKSLIIFLKHKGLYADITFKELYKKTNKKLVITGTNLSKSRLEYFDYITTPDMKIIQAMRISACIPLYFTPVKYKNDIYIDGGLLENFPISYIKDEELINTIGLLNYRENQKLDIDKNIINYIISIYDMIRKMEIIKPDIYLIRLNPNLSGGDFDTSNEKRKECFEYGANITLQFIANKLLLQL